MTNFNIFLLSFQQTSNANESESPIGSSGDSNI